MYLNDIEWCIRTHGTKKMYAVLFLKSHMKKLQEVILWRGKTQITHIETVLRRDRIVFKLGHGLALASFCVKSGKKLKRS